MFTFKWVSVWVVPFAPGTRHHDGWLLPHRGHDLGPGEEEVLDADAVQARLTDPDVTLEELPVAPS
jgi:hypothetical protein